ncbi:MAG: tRNA-dihydrouridine synthase family protein [Bacteroides sp.]|nr:tRNA-dihydrouridine synthase family protein [Bacteroides sp.]
MNNPKLLFAPFKGLTTKVFRNAFERHFGGFNAMYAPFVSGLGNDRIHPAKLYDFLPRSANLVDTVPQILSNDARQIILLGKAIHTQGFDHLNWNLGCPFSRIASKKRGCGILPYPEQLDQILHKVFKELPLKLSIKTRLGYFQPSEILSVLEVLNHYPIHLLIIHARVGTQIYSGEVDLDSFGKCLDISKIKLSYNGDIVHIPRFRELQQRFPNISTWMIGRGALINPFLPNEIKGIHFEYSEKRKRLSGFHQELIAEGLSTKENEARLLGSLKAVWYYMSGYFENPLEVFSAIKRTTTLDQYQQILGHTLGLPFADDDKMAYYFRNGIKHLGDKGY